MYKSLYITDPSLSTSISTETSTRSSQTSSLSTILSSEVSNRVSGDLSLSSIISVEVSSRISGDTSLSQELSKRQDITDNLEIGDLLYFEGTTISGMTNLMPSLSTVISSEISDRISVDSSLSVLINNKSLSGLTDVLLTNLTDNDILYNSGGTWKNTPKLWEVSNSAVTLSNEEYNLSLSSIELPEDGGVFSLVDIPVTSGASYGTEESYSFNVNGFKVATVYSESDGSGSTMNNGLIVEDYFYLGNPKTNGSWRWFINNDGNLEFQKLEFGIWVYKTIIT